MKQLMEHLLIGSLSFAAIVLILIFIAYIKSECSCCRKRPPIEIEEGVEDGPLIDGGNNNGPGVPSAYPSRLISPSVPTLMELEDSPPARIRRNTSTLSIEPEISPEEMRAIQQGLLRNGEQGPASEVKADNQCNIIIGVHTNSIVFSGYCVNLQDKMVEFYTIQTEHLPWHASDQSDHLENEMRNFFFALMLWYEKLADCKRFHIYTGSRASIYDNNRLWRKAAKLLEHFCHCERIVVGNDNHFYVSPRHDPTSFAIKIFPAEDLSAGKYEDFQNFIMQFYDIPLMNFSGTHRILATGPGLKQILQAYEVTENYQQYIDKVHNTRMKWKEPCPKCTYLDDEVTSASKTNLATAAAAGVGLNFEVHEVITNRLTVDAEVEVS